MLQHFSKREKKNDDNHFKALYVYLGYKSHVSFNLFFFLQFLHSTTHPFETTISPQFLPKSQALGFHPTKLRPQASHSKKKYLYILFRLVELQLRSHEGRPIDLGILASGHKASLRVLALMRGNLEKIRGKQDNLH